VAGPAPGESRRTSQKMQRHHEEENECSVHVLFRE
jgi:hypothetical protein